MTYKDSLLNIDKWLDIIEDYDVPKLILGNKSDLKE